jgi:hypothetical protein
LKGGSASEALPAAPASPQTDHKIHNAKKNNKGPPRSFKDQNFRTHCNCTSVNYF